MYLKRIEMKGFKSFAERTVIEFNENITCIVGPNGSGKSNITDAFRWVLGEQKHKNLRGSNMQDVIFNGTKTRSPLGYAQVDIVFDNSCNILPTPYNEVCITRKLFRSGESEYYINNNECRLKDIKSLIVDTGIGVEGYSIIAQGRIEQLLSTNKNDRRLIFEEAAGIVKYKGIKEESIRKLENAQVNLNRVSDILGELEGRVEPLKIESEKAKRYNALNDELKNLEINIFIEDIESLDKNLKIATDELVEVEIKRDSSQRELEEISVADNSLKADEERLKSDVENKRSEFLREENYLTSLKHDIDIYEQKKQIYKKNIDELLAENKLDEIEYNKFLEQADELEGKNQSISEVLQYSDDCELSDIPDNFQNLSVVEKYRVLISQLNKINRDIGKNQHELMIKNADIGRSQDDIKRLENSIFELTQRMNKDMANREALLWQEKNNEGMSYATKEVLKLSKQDSAVHGIVKDLFDVEEKFETAIEVALGRSLQNIVVDDAKTASKYIEMLKRASAGRATFLPLNEMEMRAITDVKLSNGFYGHALKLIKFDKKYLPSLSYMLNNVYIADNLEIAKSISVTLSKGARIVTLDGDLFIVGGAITGGSFNKKDIGLLKRKGDIIRLDGEISISKSELEELNTTRLAQIEKIDIIKAKKDELSSVVQTLVGKRGEYQGQIDQIKINIESSISDKKNYANKLSLGIEKRSQRIKDIGAQIDEIENNISSYKLDIDKMSDKLSVLEKNINELNTSLALIISEREQLEGKIRRNREALNAITDSYLSLNLEKSRLETRRENIVSNLWERYDMSFVQALDYKTEFDYKECAKRVKSLKSDIKEIGHVNISSIAEYETVLERYEFLSAQREDLLKANNDLLGIIKEMDTKMRDGFEKKLEEIKKNFSEVFYELFGGGSVDIELEGSADILEAEICINAQPPGKKIQSLDLMSGGEKALTAIALLFAILKTKPSPFCILDEIEAALDDVNIFRFSEFLKKYIKNSQFIIITHRRGTMEIAKALYGVTMHEKGVSTILSMKLGG